MRAHVAKSDEKEQSQGSLARDRVRRTSFWEQPWNPSCLKLKSGKHGCFNPELAGTTKWTMYHARINVSPKMGCFLGGSL